MRRVFNVIDSTASRTPLHKRTAPASCMEAVQSAWAQALRSQCEKTRASMLCKLAEHTQDLAEQYPEDPEVLLWQGVVLTGYAKSLGGLCGLQIQALARKSLEQAIALAPHNGAAYLYLGLLYDHAPPDPFSFGDERKARDLLEKGLALTLNSAERLRRA